MENERFEEALTCSKNITPFIAGFFNCGFARVAARNSVYDEKGKVIYDRDTRLQRFLGTFSESKDAFAVSQNTFDKRLPVLLKNVKKWRGESKSKYLDHFSSSAWKSLSALKRDYIPSRAAGNAK